MADPYQALVRFLAVHDRIALAFSGGTDSSLLAAAAKEAAVKVLAVTISSEFQTRKDLDHALHMAKALRLSHEVMDTRVLEDQKIRENSRDRCYWCKRRLFSLVKKKAIEKGFHVMAHGANLDDLKDFRPGFRAAQEAGFLAPLIDAGLTKAHIRNYSKDLGLETWNLPSQSCLAARIPYNEAISLEKLARIEKAETILHDLGFASVRVRHHRTLARIEMATKDMNLFMARGLGQTIADRFRELGFTHTALDLEGYCSGSLNRALD